jgi:hypothetical protein
MLTFIYFSFIHYCICVVDVGDSYIKLNLCVCKYGLKLLQVQFRNYIPLVFRLNFIFAIADIQGCFMFS